MTELTLEELAELEQRLGPSLRLTAACSMARELIRLKSALVFLDRGDGKRGTHGSDMRAPALLKLAAELGWPDPLRGDE